MSAKVGCDMHNNYSFFSIIDEDGVISQTEKVKHRGNQLDNYLQQLPEGTQVALEACGGWYQMVDAIEEAGLEPKLTNARKAKVMMGNVDKTDKLDAEGLATLMAAGTLPEVWIPPKEVRDQRELMRCRIYLVGQRTRLKNRVHSILQKYGLKISASDLFGAGGRAKLQQKFKKLPEQHRYTLKLQLELIDQLTEAIDELSKRVEEVLKRAPGMELLTTAPGIGRILAGIICMEVGDISRFPEGKNLASYAGTVPRVHATGGTVKHGETKKNVNHYLKWAYAEAANVVAIYKNSWSDMHVAQKYQELNTQKCHGIAIGAVSRHLAEATWHMLTKEESYKDPNTD